MDKMINGNPGFIIPYSMTVMLLYCGIIKEKVVKMKRMNCKAAPNLQNPIAAYRDTIDSALP